MKFNIRDLTENDYDDLLVGWWKDWRWTAPPKDFLPDNGKGGYVVLEGETPICAGYIYFTNSSVGWCDLIVSDFNYKDKVKRKEALKRQMPKIMQIDRIVIFLLVERSVFNRVSFILFEAKNKGRIYLCQ